MLILALSLACPRTFLLVVFVDLALAYSVGAGVEPDVTCNFKLDECAGSGRDFVVACLDALAASTSCRIFGSLLISLYFLN